MKSIWLFFTTELKSVLEYRSDAITHALFTIIMPLFMLVVWLSVLDSGGNVNFTKDKFIQYFVYGVIVNIVIESWHGYRTAQDIRQGNISSYLLKPLHFFAPPLGSTIAGRFYKLFFYLPVLGVFLILYSHELFSGIYFINLIPFLIAVSISSLMNFYIDITIGMLAFWIFEVGAIKNFFNIVLLLFSGQIVPLVLIPYLNHAIIELLPFRYIFSFPLEILLGTISREQMLYGFTLQILWFISIIALYEFTRKKGFKSYQAFGS